MNVDKSLEKCFCERPQEEGTCQQKARYGVKRHFCVSERKTREQFKRRERVFVDVFEASFMGK